MGREEEWRGGGRGMVGVVIERALLSVSWLPQISTLPQESNSKPMGLYKLCPEFYPGSVSSSIFRKMHTIPGGPPS